ncbi:hypothetical protein D3C72_638330 [compost metagenome]
MCGKQGHQCLKVFGRTPLPDQDFHSMFDLIQSFFQCSTLMVGTDSRPGITDHIRFLHLRCMAINRLAIVFCPGDLFHHLLILVQYPGEIHHFCQVPDLLHRQQFFDLIRIDDSTGCFETCSRYTGRCSEIKLKGGITGIFDHVMHPFHTTNISDLMRIGYGCDCTIDRGHSAECCRRKHRAFDMYMGIYKAGKDILRRGLGHTHDLLYPAIQYDDPGRV